MPNLPRRQFLALSGGAALAGLVAGPATPAAARSAAVPPPTIPALQSWTVGSGQYVVPSSVRIIVRGADAAALRPAAETLAAALAKALNRPAQVEVQDTPAPAAGDIVLRLAAAVVNGEGYEIKVGAALEVSGQRAGVFHAAQTIVQWLKQATTVPGGVARDWPKYPERGFLVANAARFYTTAWWKGQLDEMAYLKLNMLWVNIGYDTAPLAQAKEIEAYAAKYNIGLVPLTGMPGHMDKLLANRPDLKLPNWGSHMDISKDAAYDFGRNEVLAPNLREFSTPYWHLGADEYITDFSQNAKVRYDLFPQLGIKAKERFGSTAQPVDVFTGFLNDMNETVRASNKQMRIWNDGLLTSITAAPLNKNIVVEHWVSWEGRKTSEQLLNEGYLVHNSNGDYLYYDPATTESPRRVPDPRRLYNEFHPGRFTDRIVDRTHPGLRGAKLHLWTMPFSEHEELQSYLLTEPFRSLSQVLWDSPRPADNYDSGFSDLIRTVGRPPLFPVGRFTTSPLPGATSVWPQRKLQVTLYDDIVPSSVQIREGGSETGIPGQTTYDAASRTATFTPAAVLPYSKKLSMSFVARTTNGQSIVGEWPLTVAKPPSIAYPRSLFNDEDGPGVEWYSDLRESELGVRFRVDRPGVVLGVKFYKAPRDVAVHTGSLWSPSGQKLATATFTGETSGGWQEVRFAQPVRIDAGGNYTVSYHSPAGSFGYNHNFFDGRTQDNGMLHTPTAAGYFSHGPTWYPTESWKNTNYWVDVIFQPDTYTLFNVGDAPVFGTTEATSLELGMRFGSSASGKVHGVRFFKGTHNTGTHVGSLWTAAGQKLTSATFTGESAGGWQEVRFAQPVTIEASADYVISYSSGGGFSATDQGLATARANGTLFTRTSQPAGIYALSAGTFPTLSYQARDYFVDPVFSEG